MILPYSIAAFVAACASLIMTFIALATPFGPWIEPVIVLIGIGFLWMSRSHNIFFILPAVAAGGIAGIVSTAVAFSLPTLFFLDKDLFAHLFQSSLYGWGLLGLIISASTFFAITFIQLFKQQWLVNPVMTFPVIKGVQGLLNQNRWKQYTRQITLSALIAGIWKILFFQFPLQYNLIPFFGSLGILSGRFLFFPLMLGILTKFFLLPYLQVLHAIPHDEIIISWCTGIIIGSIIFSLGKKLILGQKNLFQFHIKSLILHSLAHYYVIGAVLFNALVLYCLGFSLGSAVYIVVAAMACMYQLVIIAGETGLAPLGRFASFVMIPGLLFLGFNAWQATLCSVFIEICGSLAVNMMFAQKLASVTHYCSKKLFYAQLIGIVTTIFILGCTYSLLLRYNMVGSLLLPAQRSYFRSLLFRAPQMNLFSLIPGIGAACIMHAININSVVAMTGVLLPPSSSMVLALGSLISTHKAIVKDYYALWSGIFTFSTLFLISVLLISLL